MRVGARTNPASVRHREIFIPAVPFDPQREMFDSRRDLLRAFENGKRRGRHEALVQALVVGIMSGLAAAALAFWIIQSLSTVD